MEDTTLLNHITLYALFALCEASGVPHDALLAQEDWNVLETLLVAPTTQEEHNRRMVLLVRMTREVAQRVLQDAIPTDTIQN